ncbi:hypothetical protein BpHYR1_011053 [Brachionus plicatilis]|uniref:Uncharacterized protein n=1 Tax=Brachionus plicatilis TaxID=10195 RepID=A0A3M7PNU0_BRAPC|nr:hypothetical protein BpHYR1_011053 [Brachionus plicatilis]
MMSEFDTNRKTYEPTIPNGIIPRALEISLNTRKSSFLNYLIMLELIFYDEQEKKIELDLL